MSTIATLVVNLVGDVGDYAKSLDKAEKQTRGALGNMGKLFAGFGVAAIGAFAAVGTAAFSSAMKLDEAYDTIRVGTGATGDELDQLKEDFKNVYSSFPTDSQTAADVVAALNSRLDVTGPFLQELSGNVLEASRLLGGDAATNAGLFARVIGDWGLPMEDASANLDAMFVAAQKSGIGLDRLMTQVVQFGAPLRLMGFGFNESVAMLAKWEKEGVNTELVLGSMRVAAGKFAKANIPLRDGLMQTIEQIQGAKTHSEALGIAMKVFGARAGPDMAAAILEGRFALGDLVTDLQNADGAIMDTAAATEDFPEKFLKMRNKVETLLAPLGMKIMDAIGGALDWLAPRIEAIVPIFEQVFSVVGGLISGLVAIFTGSQAPLDAWSGWWQNLESLIGANATNAIRGFINILAGAVAWVQTNWPTIQREIVRVFEQARSMVEPVLQAIGSIVGAVFDAIGTFIATHGEDIKAFIANAWGTIQNIIQSVGAIIQEFIVPWLQGIAAFIQAHGETIQSIFSSIWNAIKTVVETVLSAIQGIINTVLSVLRGDWEGAWNEIKGVFETLWNGLKAFVDNILNAAGGILRIIFDALGGILSWFNLNVVEPVTTAWDNFWGGLRATVESVINGILGFIKGLVDAWNAFWGQFQQQNPGPPPSTAPPRNTPGRGRDFATGTNGWWSVPSGFPNDSYRIGLSSGELFNVVPNGMRLAATGAGDGGGFHFEAGAIVIYAQPGQSAAEIARATIDEAARRADARRRTR